MQSDAISNAGPPEPTPQADYVVLNDATALELFEEGGNETSRAVPQKAADQASRSINQDLEQLNALLNRQAVRPRREQRITANLHRQFQMAEADKGRIRSELRTAREKLALAQQDHNLEMRLAEQRETGLRYELAGACYDASVTLESMARSRGMWLRICATIAAGAAFWVTMLYWQLNDFRSDRRYQAAAAVERGPPAVAVAIAPPTAAANDFTGAITELDDALGSFRGNRAEDVLRRVHNESAAQGVPVCSFEWNNGQPSLLYGSKKGDPALATAVSLCAQAVKKAAQ